MSDKDKSVMPLLGVELDWFEKEMNELSLDQRWFGAARRGKEILAELRRLRAQIQ